jgi:hypothetical protein
MKKVILVLMACAAVLALSATVANAQIYTGMGDTTALGIFSNESMQGCAWGDYDGDGYLDVMVSTQGTPALLYHNNGKEINGKWFTLVSKTSKTDPDPQKVGYFYPAYRHGALWADFDNDGKLDYGCTSDAGISIFRNNGVSFDSVFALACGGAGQKWGLTCADFDGDGYVDLALGSGSGGPSSNAGPLCILHNDYTAENKVSFSDVTNLAVTSTISLIESWNPFAVDYNNDGAMDLFIPCFRNQPQKSELLINDGGGVLSSTDPAAIGLAGDYAITNCWGDYNNDGNQDLYVVPHTAAEAGTVYKPQLFKNNGDGTFTETGAAMNSIDTTSDAWTTTRGVMFGDYDNDGFMDLYIGSVYGVQRIFKNNDGTGFTLVTGIGADTAKVGARTMVIMDYNRDGYLDIFTHGYAVYKRLMTNSGGSNKWIGIIPVVTAAQRTAGVNGAGIGAKVQVVIGSKKLTRVINAGNEGGSSCAGLWANFGLGMATTVDSLIVTWPNKTKTVATNLDVNKYYNVGTTVTLTPTGVEQSPNELPTIYSLSQNYPNPFNPSTNIEFTLPVRSDVRLMLVNVLGQVVKEIATGNYNAGTHQVTLDASSLASGVYFYKLQTANFSDVKKLVLMK